jgi:hypothetical protein
MEMKKMEGRGCLILTSAVQHRGVNCQSCNVREQLVRQQLYVYDDREKKTNE